ncbi:MAG: sulfite exporter TauE/SafE family protein [Chitinophagaceae bacterium]|nr:sulfite exporter TauE/SafE family protein [Chitinophagaceae bacterium]
MDNFLVLVITGFLIGAFGTVIGAGGGFILVPLLIFTHPNLPAETITAISMAIVALNAISGSAAYARAKRIDFKAGWKFALFSIPGSIAGVYVTQFIPKNVFQIAFGILLIAIALFLLLNRKQENTPAEDAIADSPGKQLHLLTDKDGHQFRYGYNKKRGIAISMVVGFISPVLGIGGGIIHVPAMIRWLHFPVPVATATSHFILAIMSLVSVLVHIAKGSYGEPGILRMVAGIGVGVVPGAFIGAYISHKIQNRTIIEVLAVCLGLVGIRILLLHIL